MLRVYWEKIAISTIISLGKYLTDKKEWLKNCLGRGHPAGSDGEHGTLDPEVRSLSPTVGVEITKKINLKKRKLWGSVGWASNSGR